MVGEQVSSPSPSFSVLHSPGPQLPRFPASAPVLGGGGRPEKEQGTRVAGAASGLVTRPGGSTGACGAAEWSMRGGPRADLGAVFRGQAEKEAPQKQWRVHENRNPESGKNMPLVIATDFSSRYFQFCVRILIPRGSFLT